MDCCIGTLAPPFMVLFLFGVDDEWILHAQRHPLSVILRIHISWDNVGYRTRNFVGNYPNCVYLFVVVFSKLSTLSESLHRCRWFSANNRLHKKRTSGQESAHENGRMKIFTNSTWMVLIIELKGKRPTYSSALVFLSRL